MNVENSLGRVLSRSALVFVAAFQLLFLGMSLAPNIYDEGLILTAAMRVEAGQIPHRDFYIPYGPAQLYLLAGLFKTFGASLLVERLFDLLIKALLIATVFAIASVYCRDPIPAVTGCIATFLVFGLQNEACGSVVTPICLLNLVSTFLILPVAEVIISRKRMFLVGALVGCAALFRYDTGLALIVLDVLLVCVAVYFRSSGVAGRLRVFAEILWPYLVGFASVFLPPAIYYLWVAPFHPFLHDLFLYPSKYYRSGRYLPFPGLSLKHLDNATIYLAVVTIGLAIYYASVNLLRKKTGRQSISNGRDWHWFLFAFGALALGMYFKGLIRISLVQIFLSIIPCLLLLAVLVENRLNYPKPFQVFILWLAALFAASAAFSSLRELAILYELHPSFAGETMASLRGAVTETRVNWCKGQNPLTKGICFLPDDDRIKTIEFIVSHTNSDQKLFVGLRRHDVVFANDNLIYFVAQRLPATRWSHFDPSLQNRYDIQTEMVRELDANAPPYIVRDSEFEVVKEPNASSISSGVTLLDEYLDKNYERVETFGAFTISHRRSGTAHIEEKHASGSGP